MLEYFVGVGTGRVTDFNGGGIDKSNPRHLSSTRVQETAQPHQTPGHCIDELQTRHSLYSTNPTFI